MAANNESTGINRAAANTKLFQPFPHVVNNPVFASLPSFYLFPFSNCLCNADSIFADRSCRCRSSIFHQTHKVLCTRLASSPSSPGCIFITQLLFRYEANGRIISRGHRAACGRQTDRWCCVSGVAVSQTARDGC